WPAAQQVKALITDGTLGQPILGHVSVLLHRESSYYSATPWRGSWETDGGGVLMTQAIHYIDLLQWFMGEVTEVYGHVNTYAHTEICQRGHGHPAGINRCHTGVRRPNPDHR